MSAELTKALLVEEVASQEAIAAALFASVTGDVPLVRALSDAGAVPVDVLSRDLARSEAPVLRQVVPLLEIMDRLPDGLCERLMAVPVRRDAITGTVDVVVPDPSDPHAAHEIAFHLRAPVRLVRASIPALDDALRGIRTPRDVSVRVPGPVSFDAFTSEALRHDRRDMRANGGAMDHGIRHRKDGAAGARV